MNLEKLKNFENLKVGDKVTKITLTCHECFEFLGYDPKLKDTEYAEEYGYFLDSFGRTKVYRWYRGFLEQAEIYLGYDTEFVRSIRIELLEKELKDLKTRDYGN